MTTPPQVLGRARTKEEAAMPEPTLVAKLAAIMAEVKALPKEGQSGEGGGPRFRFVTVGQMIETARPLMAAAGIILYPDAILKQAFEEGQTRSGNATTECYLTIHWTATDGHESIGLETIGEAHDSGDKAANKAMTAAQKQALKTLFQFNADEDPDAAPVQERQPRRASPQDARPPGGQPQPRDAHWCAKHKTRWFKTPKMPSYGHPIGDTKEWCHESASTPGAASSREAQAEAPGQAPALMTPTQFWTACKDRDLNAEGVRALLGETVAVLHAAGRSFDDLLAEIDQVRSEGQAPEEAPDDPFDNGAPTA